MSHLSIRLALRALLVTALSVSMGCPFMAAPGFKAGYGGMECAAPQYRVHLRNGCFEYYSVNSGEPDLSFSLTEVRYGGRSIILRRSPAQEAHGAVASFDYGPVIERYSARDDGVEQTWTIRSRPRIACDITIRGRLQTRHELVHDSRGMRFVDKSGHTIVRYGSVTVIDADGRKVEVQPRVLRGNLSITVPASFVKDARFPIIVDPVVGPDQPICPTFGPALKNQENVEIAASPTGYLAVWQDSRGPNDIDIFACRYSLAGEILDAYAIAVSDAAGDQTDPAVAWDGQEYLVVWSDRRSANQHICAARVRSTGEVIDRQGLSISGTAGAQAYARVASDDIGWLVVWQDASSSSPDIRGRKVNPDGSMSSIYGIATTTNNEETPDIAWNGTNFFVVWRDYRNIATTDTDIYGCRVAKTGVRLAGDTLVSCTSGGTTGAANAQLSPRICSYGTACFVVWEDFRNSASSSDLYGSRVNSSGTVLDKGGKIVSNAANNQEMPAVGFDGSKMLVAWRDSGDRLVKCARVDTNGSLLDANARLVSTGMAGSGGIAVSGKANKFVVGWNSLDVTNSDVLATLVTDGGTIQTPGGATISLGIYAQQGYSAADTGSEYAIVWSQLVNGSYDILGARLSHSGTLLTPTPVNLTASYAGDQLQPSIAWSGTQYLLVWSGNESSGSDWSIRGWRLDGSLNKIGASPITICAATGTQEKPTAASNGSSFLVAWQDSRNAASPYYYKDLYGAVVNSSGVVAYPDIAISVATGDQLNPSIASNASDFFVVWEDCRTGYPLAYGARVRPIGQVQDASGIQMPATSYYQTGPNVCFGGGNYFVTWSDYYNITACRVSTAGSKLDPSGISIDTGSKMKLNPNTCWDSSKYRVVWEDYRSSYTGNADVYYTTVSSAGVVSTDPKSALMGDLMPQLGPQIFAQTSSGMLFYTRYFNFADEVWASQLTELPVQRPSTIGEAKQYAPGTLLILSGKIVTGAFSGYFYIEDIDRMGGIKVVSSVPVAVDDVVDVTGAISVIDSERQIDAYNVATLGIAADPPEPFLIRGDSLGGGWLNAYTPGITGAYGLNNFGLLAKTWGKVTSTGSNYFYIEPQTALSIKVYSGSLTKPAVGKFVAITGISTCEIISGATCRAIRPRVQSDIQILN